MALIIVAHPDLEKSVANRTIVEEMEKSDLKIEIRKTQNHRISISYLLVQYACNFETLV